MLNSFCSIVPNYKPQVNVSSIINDNKYVCNLCNATFTRKNSLKRHQYKHSKNRPYECITCSKTFYRADIYNRHLKSKKCQKLKLVRFYN